MTILLALSLGATSATTPAPAEPAPPTAETPSPAATAAETPETAVIVRARLRPSKIDPLVRINEKSYAVVQDLDKAVVAPLANGYKSALPNPLRSGIRNGLRNIGEPVVALNFVLQFKLLSALKTTSRFAVNSTMGLGGIIDVAKTKGFNLPYRANGFANTLGYYGVGPGPYFFLPIIGPTTLRDGLGLGIDRAFLPAVGGHPFNKAWFAASATVVRSLDDRVELDEILRELHKDSDGAYAATRRYYLKNRQAEIDALKGKTAQDATKN